MSSVVFFPAQVSIRHSKARIRGPVTFRAGRPGEIYQGMGRESVNVAGLPVFADQEGPFGSPTRDSEHITVTLNTRDILMVIISFTGRDRLDEFVQRTVELLPLHVCADSSALETSVHW